MGFHVDLKEFNEVLAKIQKDTSKTNNQLEQAQRALNGIIQADAMQGATGNAIVNDINNNQSAVVTGLKVTNEFLIAEMLTTLKDFQSTTGESDENAVILEDALLQTQNKLSNLQPKKHEMDSRISNIYNSVNDLISLSMPRSQFDEKLVAASKELEDTIQKVQQFESKKAESNAEKILDKLNNQVQMAREMGSLSYTDPQLQDFFAQDALAKGIHEMDTQITKAENEAKLQAEGEMKKKQEEWANHHPAEAWLQVVFASIGKKWDGLEKGTRWLGKNIPALKEQSDKVLMLEGLIGAAGSTISGAATGVIKSVYLVLELGESRINKIRGVETEQWKLDDLDATWEGTKKLAEYGIVGYITTKAPHLSKFLNNPELTDKIPVLDNLARTYRKDEKEMYNAVKDYVEKAMTDPYSFGGMIFDIGSFCVGVGEVAAVVNGGKIAEGANLFQAARKSDKIVGKSEEVAALTNKLPGMKNALEKIRNMEIRDLSPETSAAGVGSVEERKTLGTLFSVAKSETKGTTKDIGKNLQNESKNIRNNLDEFKNNYKKSDEYLNLSNSKKKIINRKLDKLGWGNVATAEVDISGIKKDFKAHSQIHSNDSLGYADDFSITPSEKDRVLTNYVDDVHPRYNDTEAKILEDIASKIKDPNIKGEINLFSELDCCQSCTNLIFEFREKFPNIKVNIITNNTLK
ncbi:deaminase domain-containing protein [Bacillus mycoides]|uniref:deaminase domain-containing protein n=1 Tax=Bacillus mycoides TaxID=1405 RepID=UPI0009927A15|nr:deaminase domain-containing protein [Bacillus mycoides]MED1436335.1 deaminase domain-containing protein [Bacillus mycoides]MED1625425.1 deaminase domain-containing protein [Bacillus mycoides]